MVQCNLCKSVAVVIIEKCEDLYCIHCLNCDSMGWIGRKVDRKEVVKDDKKIDRG